MLTPNRARWLAIAGSTALVAGGLTYVGTEDGGDDGDRLVPEPGALALLGIGVALLRRRRR